MGEALTMSTTTSRQTWGAAVGGAGITNARQLLRRARIELEAADASTDPQMRFLHAHMAAIRAAAAVLAIGGGPVRRRRRVLSVWEQLAERGEEWEAWAEVFAAGAGMRAAIEAGRAEGLEGPAADAAVAAVELFLDEVTRTLSAVDLASPIAS